MTEQTPRLFTPNDAAHYLRVSRSTVYELMNRGDLRFITVGTRRRLVREDLDGFVNERLTNATP
jgi:excisionase family DNA binding protein